MTNPPPVLILASASPRRRELLAGLGVEFEVMPAEIAEHEASDADPRKMVRHNAALKADWVAARRPDALVLGADTTVCIDRIVLNKPRDLAEARGMLRRLSGRTHTVYTGLALRRHCDRLALEAEAASEVTFKPLNEAAIDRYFSLVDPPRQGWRLCHPGGNRPHHRRLARFLYKHCGPADRRNETNFDSLRSLQRLS